MIDLPALSFHGNDNLDPRCASLNHICVNTCEGHSADFRRLQIDRVTEKDMEMVTKPNSRPPQSARLSDIWKYQTPRPQSTSWMLNYFEPRGGQTQALPNRKKQVVGAVNGYISLIQLGSRCSTSARSCECPRTC
jgi:hypothetical protein